VRARHGEDVRRAFHQRGSQRLAAQSPDVRSFLLTNVDGVHAWRLATHRVHSGGSDLDVFAIAQHPAKKAFRHRAPANISCANKEDAFHGSRAGALPTWQSKIKPNQVNARLADERESDSFSADSDVAGRAVPAIHHVTRFFNALRSIRITATPTIAITARFRP
jgi:hypothetical protein